MWGFLPSINPALIRMAEKARDAMVLCDKSHGISYHSTDGFYNSREPFACDCMRERYRATEAELARLKEVHTAASAQILLWKASHDTMCEESLRQKQEIEDLKGDLAASHKGRMLLIEESFGRDKEIERLKAGEGGVADIAFRLLEQASVEMLREKDAEIERLRNNWRTSCSIYEARVERHEKDLVEIERLKAICEAPVPSPQQYEEVYAENKRLRNFLHLPVDDMFCPSCGVAFASHLGLIGTCKKLKEANAEIERLTRIEKVARECANDGCGYTRIKPATLANGIRLAETCIDFKDDDDWCWCCKLAKALEAK